MEEVKDTLPLAKYELHVSIVNYLRKAANSLQIRGEGEATDLLKVLHALDNPLNREELVEAQSKEEKKDIKKK